MNKAPMKRIKQLFPDLTGSQHRCILEIYVSHVEILELEDVKITDGKIKAIMDTITYSIKQILNLRTM